MYLARMTGECGSARTCTMAGGEEVLEVVSEEEFGAVTVERVMSFNPDISH